MGIAYKNNNENVYYQCRKEAAKYNDKLNSREGAAELLGVSPSSLADYELGITKYVPVDKVLLMADLYNAPQLCTAYCNNECPIGKRRGHPCELKPIELTTLKLLDLCNAEKIAEMLKSLTHIASDGEIEKSEEEDMKTIVEYLNKLRNLIEELALFYQKQERK